MGSILKKILVTGCSGLVGTKVCNQLLLDENNLVFGIDIKLNERRLPLQNENFVYQNIDITDIDKINALFDLHKFDGVINAFGIKGSPIRAKESPLDFLTPSIKGNINIIENSYKHNSFLVFLSSVGVYAPAEVFIEDTVWKTLPSEHDWFPSWSKRIPEIYLEAYKVQHNWNNFAILRPANIFGEDDNFNEGSTVIAATIKKVANAEDNSEIIVWGDGTPTRDFIFAGEVSNSCIKVLNNKQNITCNLGSGEDISIEKMVLGVIKASGKNLKIVYDTSKPNGDKKRKMSVERQFEYGLKNETDFQHGLTETYNHYYNNIKNEII